MLMILMKDILCKKRNSVILQQNLHLFKDKDKQITDYFKSLKWIKIKMKKNLNLLKKEQCKVKEC